MKTLYIECSMGAAGDMLMAALYELLEDRQAIDRQALFRRAAEERRRWYGDTIYVRGLIELTSYCKNNCLYCGIRAGNSNAGRYRLDEETVLECCRLSTSSLTTEAGRSITSPAAILSIVI